MRVAFPSRLNRAATLRETPEFLIRFDTPLTLNDALREYVFPLQNLLTLATDHANSVGEVRLTLAEEKPASSAVEFFFHGRPPHSEPREQLLFSEEMLFHTGDIPFEGTVPAWLALSRQFAVAADVYFGALYADSQTLETRFFFLVQAAEAYYRKKTPRGNNAKLSVILTELVSRDATLLKEVIDSATFATEVIQTRDFIAHRPAKRPPSLVEGEPLFWLSERMDVLLKLCWLNELSIDEAARAGLVKRQFRFQRLRRASIRN
jgi:hypothetical protein